MFVCHGTCVGFSRHVLFVTVVFGCAVLIVVDLNTQQKQESGFEMTALFFKTFFLLLMKVRLV